jgi:hypothetical protein
MDKQKIQQSGKRLIPPPTLLIDCLSQIPVEEEAITPETAAALDQSRNSLANGRGIPHEDVLREFSPIK